MIPEVTPPPPLCMAAKDGWMILREPRDFRAPRELSGAQPRRQRRKWQRLTERADCRVAPQCAAKGELELWALVSDVVAVEAISIFGAALVSAFAAAVFDPDAEISVSWLCSHGMDSEIFVWFGSRAPATPSPPPSSPTMSSASSAAAAAASSS